MTVQTAKQVPDSIGGPLDHLRRNAGLKDVEPIFASRRGRPARREMPPRHRHRLAAAASVADIEDDARAGVAVLSLSDKRIDGGLLKTIGAAPGIDIAERLPARWLAATSADPKVNLQWGLAAIRYFDAKRPSAAKLRVAVIDTGIDTQHPDLPQPVLYRHTGFRAQDPVGHGSHVAGIIAAKSNNRVGISGICDCELAIWKVFPDDPNDPYLDGESYLRALGEVIDEEVSVVNLSIGGGAHSDVEASLFSAGVDAGVTFVAAMGNDYENGNPTSYPAAYDDVISVGAMAENRRRSPFSNTGSHIDLSAPGSNILSTLPTQRSAQRQETDYAPWSGTSMATPHVAAAATLLLGKHPNWSPALITRRLRSTATSVSEMKGKGWTQEHGTGMLDLKAAVS